MFKKDSISDSYQKIKKNNYSVTFYDIIFKDVFYYIHKNKNKCFLETTISKKIKLKNFIKVRKLKTIKRIKYNQF